MRLEIPVFGNVTDFSAQMARAGIVADDTSKKIAGSFKMAGVAAAEEAARIGASVEEQAAAAGRAAVAFTDMSATITTAQRNAGKAAAAAAGKVGASVDEQRAAYKRAIAVQSEYEASTKRAADAAVKAAAAQAAAYKRAAAEQVAAVESSSKKMASLGKYTLGAALGAGFFSVKGATNLQSQMERTHTQAGASQKQVGVLTQGVLNEAGPTGTSAGELAQGMYHVVSSLNKTLPATTAASTELKVLRVAADGAKVGGANLVDVTNALDAALVSGIKGVGNYKQAMGALNATVGAGDMTMQNLADAMGASGLQAIAGEAGLSIKDLGAALAVFGDNNVRGADAGTKLASAIRIMGAPSQAAAKALKSVGISQLELANDMRSGGLMKALTDLQQKLRDSGATANQQALILTRAFGGRQSSGVRMLLSQLDRLKSSYKQVGSGAQHEDASVAAYHKTLAFQTDQLKATVGALGDKFGLFLIPKLQAAGAAVQSVIGWFEKHQAAAKALAAVIGGVLSVAIATFAYVKAAAFINATKGMLSGIGTFAAKLLSLIPGVNLSVASVGSTAVATESEFAVAGDGMVASADTTAAGVDAALSSTGIGAIMVGVALAATEMATHWSAVMDGMKAAVNAMVQAAESALNGLISALNGAISVFNSTIGQVTGSIGPVGKVGVSPAFGGGKSGPQFPSGSLSSNFPVFGTSGTLQSSPSWGGGPVPVPSSGSNWQRIAGALARQGFSKVAIAGILGNFAQETGGGNLNAITPNATGPSGLGIEQDTGSRRAALTAYATAHHESVTSLAAQVGYLVQELRTNFHNVFTKIQNAPSAAAAARIFDASPAAGGFEGGTDPGGIREKAAAQAMAMLTGSNGTGGPSKGLLDYLNGTAGKKPKKQTYGPSTDVLNMLKLAQELVGAPYNNREGHAAAFNETVAQIKKFGTDCSGLVSVLLKEGISGIKAAQTTQGLPTNAGLAPGAGKYVTVYDRHTGPTQDEHTIIDILGHYFESGGNKKYNPTGGVSELSKAQAAGELAGGGFQAYHPTAHALNAAVAGGKGAYSGIANAASLQSAINSFIGALVKGAQSMLTKLDNAVQSGTVRSLANALGENTSMMLTTPGVTRTEYGRPVFHNLGSTTRSVASRLNTAIHGLGGSASVGQIDKATTGIVSAGVAGSPQEKAFQSQVLALVAAGQKKLADQLVAAHKAAMAALGEEMYAAQLNKDSESLQLQATKLQDQTTAIQNYASAVLNVQKAMQQKVDDAASSMVQHMQDMQQIMDDRMAGIAQSIKDAATLQTDRSSAVVDAINDQTQTQVDQIGERGLYGLNLVAQRLQVQSDLTKSFWDQQIDTAQQQLDSLQMQADAAENAAQINLDEVTTLEHLLIAQAQARLDSVTIAQDQRIATAQAHADAVQSSVDITKVGPAQIAVDLNANAPKGVQDVYAAQLKKATVAGQVQIDAANNALANVTASAGKKIQDAQSAYDTANNNAQSAIENATDSLKNITNYYDTALAQSGAGLAATQGAAATAEAGASSATSIEQAKASTQFAGGGLVVNNYGVDMSNPGAVSTATSWAIRTAVS